MIFIAGISTGKKIFPFRQMVTCKACGRYSSITIFMTYTYFSFFFIPLFKWNKQYYAVSNCCQTIFSIPKDLGESIASGKNIVLQEDDLTPISSGTIYCPNCGIMLEKHFVYCPKCGTKINDAHHSL